MTQDQPQTPEPNQPQPPQPATESPAEESSIDSSTPVSPTHEIPLTDETLANAVLGDVPPEENQLQSSDSRSEEAVASIEVSATEVSATEVSATADQETVGIDQTPVPASATQSVQSTQSTSPPSEASAQSAPKSKSPPTPEPRSTPSNKAVALLRLMGQVWGIVLPFVILVGRWLWQVLLATLKLIGEAWKVALPRIRTLLPEGWRKLPDWALTTVAVSLLVFMVWLTVQLWPGQPPAVARTGDRTPPALTAPAPEQPLVSVPDPALIANIQTQVAEVTDQYAAGLIQAVQANFQSDLLTVKVGDSWFTLDPGSQAQLANELLKRSHKLDFDALELTDPEGELLARSPVVGSKMVIYGRRKEEG